jgi:hypothetical protein
MDAPSIILAGILVAFTGFGALVILAVASMLFAAGPAAVGWAATRLLQAIYRRFAA